MSTTPAAPQRAPVAGQRARWRPWHAVPGALLLLLALVAGWWLRPTVQRDLVLEKLTPLVDELALDYVHITPWSLELRGLRVVHRGAVYQAAGIEAGFNPLGLLAHTLSLRHLELYGVVADLREMAPAAPATTPFAGVLAVLDQGYALTLGRLDARASVRLPGEQVLDVALLGGGLRALARGELRYALRYAGPAAGQAAEVRGHLALTQINRGRLREFAAEAHTAFALAPGVRAEPLAFSLRITPPKRALGEDDDPSFRTLPDGTRERLREPETVHAELLVGEDTHARLALDGIYRGENGRFTADYTLAADQRLIVPYAGAAALPGISASSVGSLDVDTLVGAGAVGLDTRIVLEALAPLLGSGAAVPQALSWESAVHGTFDASAFTLDALTLALDEARAGEVLTASLGDPVVVPYATPLAVLDAPRELATLALGPLPLSWFEGRAAGHRLAGVVAGNFALVVDDEARFRLEPREATTISGLRVTAPAPAADAAVADADADAAPAAVEEDFIPDPEPPSAPVADTPAAAAAATDATAATVPDGVLIDGLSISLLPTASWSQDYLRYALNEVRIVGADAPLATLNLKAASRQGGTAPRSWRYRLSGDLDYDALAGVPVIAAQLSAYPMPAGLALRVKGLIDQRANAVSIEKAEIDVREPAHPEALQLRGLRPFHLVLGADGVELTNRTGDLATIATRGFELAWLNPLLPDVLLAGRVAAADLVLSAPSAGTLTVTAAAPLRVEGFGVTQAGRTLVRQLDLAVTSYLMYSKQAAAANLRALSVRSGRRELLGGSLEVAIGDLDSAAPRWLASGTLAFDPTALAVQPVLAAALRSPLPAVAMQANTRFAVDVEGDAVTAREMQAELRIGDRAQVLLAAQPGLVIRTRLAAGANLASLFVGDATLEIRDLSSATVGEFFALERVSFAEIDSTLRVRSDGTTLRANTLAPLGIEAVRVSDGERALFEEFSLRSAASLSFEAREMRALFEDLELRFAARPGPPAIAGTLRAHLEPGRAVPLTLLEATLAADLPPLLAQPAVLPGHKLQSGSLAMRINIDAAHQIAANLLLSGLAADKPLAIQTLELPVTGELAADGRGFDFSSPLVGRGKSGVSNAAVNAHYAPQPDEPRVLHLDIASEVFYLNDILATFAAISPKAGSQAKRAKVVLDETADERAAWKVLPYAVVIDLNVDKLFYSDYLAFTDVGGELDLRTRKLALNDIRAHFHDSAIRLGGVTRFTPGQAEPYALDLTATVKDFDLNQFFRELVPGEKPRVKGLFGGDVKAFGSFPNFSQARNKVLFDVVLTSRDGLFRPLPPSSGLLVGASDVLGLVGETLSYVPTGAFGAGAVARLVNYIARIDYDSIDIHLRRDERRDVVVEQFLVLSPTIALTANGGIRYEAGKDLLDSPLELNAHLDMLGRGAAILYSMDLMQDTQSELGYWRGPEFRIWGTPAEPQSNFNEIVEKAGDGTLKGAITRPISGLIGNLKYRWFNNDSRTREAAQQERRKAREALDVVAREAAALEAGDSVPAAAPAPASDGQ